MRYLSRHAVKLGASHGKLAPLMSPHAGSAAVPGHPIDQASPSPRLLLIQLAVGHLPWN